MKTPPMPFMITGPHVLGEILRRNALRKKAARLGMDLGTHRAQLGDKEHVESNLPLRSRAGGDQQ
ncbi:MAG TPA: hypothetical protein VNP98_17225 [Chthoniobacterales bacterium]|nr:hypothetical protein [Chthoniobacterales bacterium]